MTPSPTAGPTDRFTVGPVSAPPVPPAPSVGTEPTAGRAFRALIWFTARRHLKVRQLGWVSLGLLALVAGIVALISNFAEVGWRLENRTRWIANPADEKSPIRMTYPQYGEERLPLYEGGVPGPPEAFGIRTAVASSYRAMMADERFLTEYAQLNYSRWVVRTLFLMYLLPLLCLAYASAAIGGERESRTLIWLRTRPLPGWAVYLAKLLGTLPWCVAVSFFGFAAMCLAGGNLGRAAFEMYWDTVLIASVSLSALFHLTGAVFRRPAVVGLVYIFFFEALVGNLPGSLKQLSLNYYIQSLFYNTTTATLTTVQPQSVDVYAPTDSENAWATLTAAAVVLTALGMYLFHRQEPSEET